MMLASEFDHVEIVRVLLDMPVEGREGARGAAVMSRDSSTRIRAVVRRLLCACYVAVSGS